MPLSTDALVALKFLDDHSNDLDDHGNDHGGARIWENSSGKQMKFRDELKPLDTQVFLQMVKQQVIERDHSRPLIDQWQITESGRKMARLMLGNVSDLKSFKDQLAGKSTKSNRRTK